MRIFSIALAISLVGCATLTPDSSNSDSAIADSKGKSGRVMYNPAGLKMIVDARRDNALKQVHEFCGNSDDYQITKEFDQAREQIAEDSLATVAASEVRVIEFKCLSKQKGT